jgi:hypothetical protein
LLVALFALAGCAGYRGGWESVAYIGPNPPAISGETLRVPGARTPIVSPGLKLEVSLDNQMRTYDAQVYLFALPLSVDARNAYTKNNAPGKTRFFVAVTPTESGFVFRPSMAVLHAVNQQHSGIAGYEFGMWNQTGERVKQGGTWQHRPTGESFALSEIGRTYYLSIDFAVAPPSPELTDIAVDVSRARLSPQHPAVPLIRFAPVRWKEGYT